MEAGELEWLAAFAPRFSELCGELAAAGIPETVQHDDLHHANVFERDGRMRVLDWGDSSISHPFASLFVTFRFLEEITQLSPEDAWFPRLRDAYLEPWGEGLTGTFELAMRVGGFAHAVAWARQRDYLPEEDRPDFDHWFAVVLRRALARAWSLSATRAAASAWCARARSRGPRAPASARSSGPHTDDPAPFAELGNERIGKLIHLLPAVWAVLGVVGIAVQAGRGNDVQAGLTRDLGEAVQVAAEAERGPVDERAAARRDQRQGLLDRLVAIEELLAGLRRRVQEQVLVRVARPEIGGGDVPEDCADDHELILEIALLGTLDRS